MKSIVKHRRLSLEAGKSITVGTHTVRYLHPIHWHSFFEIEIMLSGEGKYVINDVEYDISKENVFLLTPTDFHYLKLNGIAEIINISFDETMMSDADMTSVVFSNIEKAYRFEEDEYIRVVNVARVLEHECGIDGDCRGALLSYVVRSLLRKNVAPSADSVANALSGIKRAIVYMELHFRENINLEVVANEAGYTSAYFSRLFKRTTGQTYKEMLTKYRLGYARTLLANGFSVADACFSSGFGSLTSFQDAFRKSYKASPREYSVMLLNEHSR